MERSALRGGDKKAKAEYVRWSLSLYFKNLPSYFHWNYFISSVQDILAKIKKLVVEEKKDVRFGEWHANDVSMFWCRFSWRGFHLASVKIRVYNRDASIFVLFWDQVSFLCQFIGNFSPNDKKPFAIKRFIYLWGFNDSWYFFCISK